MPTFRKTGGDQWTAELVDGVIAFSFFPGLKLDTFETVAYEASDEYLWEHAADGLVTVVELDDLFTSETVEVWEQTAELAVKGVVTR